MWVIDNPWPPFILLLLAAAALAWRWSQSRRPVFLIAAGGLVLAAAGVHVVDALVVTDAEIVEKNIHELVEAFQARDLPKTKSFLAPNVQPVQVPGLIATALSFVTIEGDIDVKDLQVDVQRSGTAAVSRFRANATVSQSGEAKQFQPSRWELGWARIGPDWKIVRVTRLDYISDREVSLLHPRTGDVMHPAPQPKAGQ